MIPRIIHCCWFGGSRTKLAEKCLSSWRRHAPGWEIREWNEDSLRAAARSAGMGTGFFDAALAAGKWAMASDWARMMALWSEGGVYLDFDVEFVAPMDCLPVEEWVSSERTVDGGVWMNPGGGIALEKNSAIARHMLDAYERLAFDPNREMMPWINARLAECVGLRKLDPEVMSPIGMDGRLRRTVRTVGVHRYAMSWASPARKAARWFSWHGMRWLVDALLGLRRTMSESSWAVRIAVCAAVLVTAASVVQGFMNGLECVDFHWESAALFLRGENPYRWFFEGRFYDGVIVDATQAPSTIAFILPFGLLPHSMANTLWDVCNLGFTVMFLLFMGRLFFARAEGGVERSFFAFAALFLCGAPWRVGMGCGQHTMFSLAFFAAALLAVERRRHWLIVGALLSAALFKYTVTVPLAFIFVIRRQWKPLAVAAAIHVALTVALGLWTGTNPVLLVQQSLEVFWGLGIFTAGNADLAAFANWLGIVDACPWAKVGYVVFGLVMLVYTFTRLFGRLRHVPLLLDISVLAILADLSSYHRCYDLVSLAFPLAFCLRNPFGRRTILPWLLVLNAFFLLRVDFALRLGWYVPISFALHLATLFSLVYFVASADRRKEVAA